MGWVIGRRWHILRPLSDALELGRVPYVAEDLYGEYPFEVVVKIIAPPPGVAGWQGLGERRHAQMEMSLPLGHVHENIAEVLDCDLDPEYGSYIVTRLYPNTLERYLRQANGQDSLTMGDALRLAEQMLAGLRAAWDRNLVHLDLKPANVALTEDGTVKLIDFGLAKHYQGINGGNYTTTAARFTLFYAPPEQMERRDGSWINRNADIRALGAVIYRMLTGYPPMLREARAVGLVDAHGRALAGDAATYLRMMDLIGAVEPAGVAELIGYVPQDLDLLLRGWLRIDPEMRCPGNPKGMAERAWLELTAVLERVHAGGEADYPVGPNHPGAAPARSGAAGRVRRPGNRARRHRRCRGALVQQRLPERERSAMIGMPRGWLKYPGSRGQRGVPRAGHVPGRQVMDYGPASDLVTRVPGVAELPA
jgi:hypothetical protein